MRNSLQAIVLFFLFAFSLAAGESQIPPMPEGVGFVATIRSSGELMAAAARYAETAGVDNEHLVAALVPFDMAAMTALAEAAGDRDREWSLIAPPGASPFREHALSIPVTSFAAFRERLAGRGGTFYSSGDGGVFLAAVPGAGEYHCEALGDDRVVLAMTPELLALARRAHREGRLPAHWAKGVMGVRTMRANPDQPNPWQGNSARTMAHAALNAVFNQLSDVIFKTDMLEADVALDGERLLVGLRVYSRPGSLLHKMAMASGVEPAPAALSSMDSRPMALAVTASLTDLFPDLIALGEGEAATFLRRDFPEQAEGILRNIRVIFERADGTCVAARYMGGRGGYYVIRAESSDPGAVAAAWRDLFASAIQAMNRAVETGALDFATDFFAVEEKQTPGGNPYVSVKLAKAHRNRMVETIPALRLIESGDLSASGLSVVGALPFFSLFMAAIDGEVVVVGGFAGDAEFAEFVDGTANPEQPLTQSSGYLNAVQGMHEPRSVTALIDINSVFLEQIGKLISGLKVAGAISGGTSLPAEVQTMVDAYEKLLPSLSSGEHAFAGLEVHSDGGVLEASISLPAQAAGRLERSMRLVQEAAGSAGSVGVIGL